MVKLRWIGTILILAAVLTLSATPCFALKKVVPETTKEAIVGKYLTGRALDQVEGLWSFTVNGYYGEVAIIKNITSEYPGWEYLGVLVSPKDNDFGKIGEAKIVLRKTAAKGVYTGVYVVQQPGAWGAQSYEATQFAMADENVMSVRVPVVGLVHFIRMEMKAPEPARKGGFASGTGFFVTPSVVITNYHVVDGATRLEVTFQNEFTLSAKVIAKDMHNDVAVLLVEGMESRVKPLPLGRTNTIKEGERVYAVGFPLPGDLSPRHKITDGLISGLTGILDDPTVFQISVPIHPGNSGGPLITSDGRSIGITRSRLVRSGTVQQNVSFAVKSDYIIPVLDIAGIKVERIDKQEKVLDAVAIMDMAKEAVVWVKAYRE